MHTRGNTLLLIEVGCLSVLIDKRMPYQGLLVFMKFIQLHGVGSEIIHLNEIKYRQRHTITSLEEEGCFSAYGPVYKKVGDPS